MSAKVDLTFYDRIDNLYTLPKDYPYWRDYIDSIERKEVPNNVMKGVDNYGRRFITLKVGIFNPETKKGIKTGQVFFERYSNSPYHQGAEFDGSFLNTSGGVKEEQYQLINDIVDGKKIKLEEKHSPSGKGVRNGYLIASMDYWEKEGLAEEFEEILS